MPLKTTDYDELTEELQEVYMEHTQNKLADAMGLTKVFNVRETDILNYEHQVIHGVGGIEEVAEGQNFPRVNSEQGDNIVWSQRQFGAVAPITKKMRKFDMHDKMRSVVASITDDAWDKTDQSLADTLIQGGATTHTDVYGRVVSSVGPNGLALFSTVHSNNTTGTTFSNIITDKAGTSNPALSRSALVRTITRGRIFTDPNGLTRPVHFDTLLVPPSLEDLAIRIVETEQLQGSPNWDSNEHLKRIRNILVWDRLETASDGTDAAKHWYMYDSRKVEESLHCLFSERPSLDNPDEITENKDWDYTIDYFYTIGLGYQAYIYKSTGAN